MPATRLRGPPLTHSSLSHCPCLSTVSFILCPPSALTLDMLTSPYPPPAKFRGWAVSLVWEVGEPWQRATEPILSWLSAVREGQMSGSPTPRCPPLAPAFTPPQPLLTGRVKGGGHRGLWSLAACHQSSKRPRACQSTSHWGSLPFPINSVGSGRKGTETCPERSCKHSLLAQNCSIK